MDGVRGVLIPGEDSEDDQPWRVQHVIGKKDELDLEEDVGSSDGDEEIACARDAANTKRSNDAYNELLQGAMLDVLDTFRVTEEERADQEQLRKRKRSGKARKAALKSKKMPSCFDDLLHMAEDSDTEPEDSGKKKGGKGRPSTPRIAKAVADNGEAEAADEGAAGSAIGGEKKGRGAPKKDPLTIAATCWTVWGSWDGIATISGSGLPRLYQFDVTSMFENTYSGSDLEATSRGGGSPPRSP